ncbi:MAG TPA: hypothetical protein PLK82_09555 [Bacteroidales bacterium]|nr:hypothetical protein [Bacteroidales bacterium]
MKAACLTWVPLFFLPCILQAQRPDPARDRASRCTENYIQLSRLGPGYSRDLSDETMAQFAALFDKNAFLSWDLRRSPSDSILPPLTVGEYLALARKAYQSRQPVLEYRSVRTLLNPGKNLATVWLRKVNLVMDDHDHLLKRMPVRLKMEIALEREKPVILGISAVNRRPPVRSLSLGAGFMLWSNVFDHALAHPEVTPAPGVTTGSIHFKGGSRLFSQVMLDLDIPGSTAGEWMLTTGLICRQSDLSASLKNYVGRTPDTVRIGPFDIACTAMERAPLVYEKLTVTRVAVPLWLKRQWNKWAYVTGGISIEYVTTGSHVHYALSRTGGGWVTNLSTDETYYLDEGHEMDSPEAGYFRGLNSCYPFDKEIRHWVVSLDVGGGIEKHFRDLAVGLQPMISLGRNPLCVSKPATPFGLSTGSGYSSLFSSVPMPSVEFSASVRFFISYTFH